ncbi:MAG: DUF2889 domain-containing protein [Bacillota bacterium]|nr:DUF2889 domain-containing protein [Bacillota bacterium]
MHCLFQRNWHSSVRLEDKNLLSEVTYCGTDREVCARLIVDPKTFAVISAVWERYRTPEKAGYESVVLPQLDGMVAYLGCGGALREGLAPLHDSYATSFFAETVRGIVQAETFLVEERGYLSAQAYEEYWNKIYHNSCRYYSNLDRVSSGWYEHVGYHIRDGCLFNRMKSQSLYLKEDSYLLNGHINDSFHGVALELELEKDSRRVRRAEGHLWRAPDPVCKESAALIKELEGINLIGFSKKDIAGFLGNGSGCVHFIDLAFDALETLNLQQSLMEGS